jgi:hypothetical protein
VPGDDVRFAFGQKGHCPLERHALHPLFNLLLRSCDRFVGESLRLRFWQIVETDDC